MIQLQFYCIFNILHPILLLKLHSRILRNLLESHLICSFCFFQCISKDVHPENNIDTNYGLNAEGYNEMLIREWSKIYNM